jgi:Flp pilus assembly protein TadD
MSLAKSRFLVGVGLAPISLLLMTVMAFGQRNPTRQPMPDTSDGAGTGGPHSVEGTVFYPGGRKVDRALKVRMGSIGFGEQFTMTDTNGHFRFGQLRGGTYTITLDGGSEFEPVRETVEIIEPSRRDGSGTIRSLQINLRPRMARAGPPPGTVNAASAAIPAPALERYNNGLKAAKEGNPMKAISELQEAVRIYPQFVAALNELGLQYLGQKDPSRAIEAFRSALRIQPEAGAPQLNLGIALVDNKQYKDAAAQLQEYLKKQATSAPAHLYLGNAFVRLGSYDDAEKELRQAVEIGGDKAAEAHRFLGIVYIEKGRKPDAVQELETYLKLAPQAKDAGNVRRIISQMRVPGHK